MTLTTKLFDEYEISEHAQRIIFAAKVYDTDDLEKMTADDGFFSDDFYNIGILIEDKN